MKLSILGIDLEEGVITMTEIINEMIHEAKAVNLVDYCEKIILG